MLETLRRLFSGPDGRARRLHERSRFVREAADGQLRWFYRDGDLI